MLGKYCTGSISERNTLAFILAFLWRGACTEYTLGDYRVWIEQCAGAQAGVTSWLFPTCRKTFA